MTATATATVMAVVVINVDDMVSNCVSMAWQNMA